MIIILLGRIKFYLNNCEIKNNYRNLSNDDFPFCDLPLSKTNLKEKKSTQGNELKTKHESACHLFASPNESA